MLPVASELFKNLASFFNVHQLSLLKSLTRILKTASSEQLLPFLLLRLEPDLQKRTIFTASFENLKPFGCYVFATFSLPDLITRDICMKTGG